MSNRNGYWGFHTLIDISGANHEAICSKEIVRNFIIHLVAEIKMVRFGEPMIERFATHDISKAGISACQMIETSSITLHLVESNNTGYIDIFSCLPYDLDIVETVIMQYFNPTKIRLNYITRNAD